MGLSSIRVYNLLDELSKKQKPHLNMSAVS